MMQLELVKNSQIKEPVNGKSRGETSRAGEGKHDDKNIKDDEGGEEEEAKEIENAIVNFGSDIGGNNNKRGGSSERGEVDESFEKQEGNSKDGRAGVVFGPIPDQQEEFQPKSKVIEQKGEPCPCLDSGAVGGHVVENREKEGRLKEGGTKGGGAKGGREKGGSANKQKEGE